MDNVVIRCRDLGKTYRLYDSSEDRLKEALHPLRKTYHRLFHALSGINLEVRKGEVLGIVGRNGSGKSTLLKLIAGITRPSAGSVSATGSIVALLELGAGFNPELTGMDNIYYYGSVLGFTRAQMGRMLGEIVEFADIGEFIHQPVRSYSSGMRARLAFSVAINVDPDILIVDEVLAVGDTAFRRKCFARMERLMNDGKTVIFVSHAEDAVVEMCSRAILLDRGKMLMEDDPAEVIKSYQRLSNAKTEADRAAAVNTAAVRKREADEAEVVGDGQRGVSRTPEAETEYLDPSLEKVVRQEQRLAEIDLDNVRIETAEGRRVNVLSTGRSYLLRFSLVFHEDVSKIVLPISMRNMRGVTVSGIRYPDSREGRIDVVEAGTAYEVSVGFTCSLLHGDYTVDIGVTRLDNERQVLLAVHDALMFRIIRDQYAAKWGIADILGSPEIRGG